MKRYLRTLLQLAAAGIFIMILSATVFLFTHLTKESTVAPKSEEDFLKIIRLAQHGDPGAQFKAGLMYLNGTGTKRDKSEAEHWLKQAAEQGHPDAQYYLGIYYLKPNGLDKHLDPPNAGKWLREAAEQGKAEAQYHLGMLYQQGIGVIQDFEEGAKWIRKAADNGVTDAMYEMGDIYLTGRGIPRDYIQAYVFFNLAAAQGKEQAVKQRDLVAASLTPQEISEAQRLSRVLTLLLAKNSTSK